MRKGLIEYIAMQIEIEKKLKDKELRFQENQKKYKEKKMKIYVEVGCWDCPLMACKEFGEDESHCPLHKIEDVQNKKAIMCLEKVKENIRKNTPTIERLKNLNFIDQLIVELKGGKNE